MNWEELQECQSYAARHLIDQRDEKLYRAACTRAYYSAYAAITARVPQGTVFPRGWQNPAHEALAGYVDQMPGLSLTKKETIRIALSQLRQRRVDADYRPGAEVNRATARESLRDLATIIMLLP